MAENCSIIWKENHDFLKNGSDSMLDRSYSLWSICISMALFIVTSSRRTSCWIPMATLNWRTSVSVSKVWRTSGQQPIPSVAPRSTWRQRSLGGTAIRRPSTGGAWASLCMRCSRGTTPSNSGIKTSLRSFKWFVMRANPFRCSTFFQPKLNRYYQAC